MERSKSGSKPKTVRQRTCNDASNKDIDLALARRIQSGDRQAFDQLVIKYRRFAMKEAWRFHRRTGLDIDDLTQEAMSGIMDAAEKFDPERDVTFLSYAKWKVREALHGYYKNHGRTIRMPSHAHAKFSKLRKAGNMHLADGKDAEIVHAMTAVFVPFDPSCEDEDDRITVNDLPDPRYGTQDQAADTVIDMIGVRELCAWIETLPDRLRFILKCKLSDDMTNDEGAEVLFGLGLTETKYTRQGIQSIEKEALKLLRKKIADD